jgi:hypothetical protein
MPLGLYLFLLLLLCTAAPVAALCLIIQSRKLRKVRRPIRSHIFRTAGRSLSDRIAEHNDSLLLWILVASFAPVAAAFTGALQVNFSRPVPAAPAVIGLLVASLFALPVGWYLIRLALRLADHRRALNAEHLVAEHLHDLARAGCYIFHDLAPSKTWNIDHIIVTPDSVLVIETCARTAPNASSPGQRDPEVTFDGATLYPPHPSDRQSLEQAVRNADYIRTFLSEALCEPVKVEPVLALPGWTVRRKAPGNVLVLHPREIRALARTRGARGSHLCSSSHPVSPATAARMSQLAFALDLKSRDVEF